MSLGRLFALAKMRATLRRGVELDKEAQLPQFSPTPLSGLTAISDFIANKKFKQPEPNPLTSDEQQLLAKLTAGMSRPRARVVGASRAARNSVRNLLSQSKLWG